MNLWQLILLSLTCVVAAAAAFVMTPVVGALARMFGLVDKPNPRTVHRIPMPRVGGIAIILATLLAIGLVVAPTSINQTLHADLTLVDLILVCLAIFAVGLLDDLINLSSKAKLIAIVTAATVLWARGARIDTIIVTDGVTIDVGVFSWLVTVLFITAITVAVNFIDGLDGLAAGIAAIALLTTATIAAMTGQLAMAFFCVAIVGGLIGFLRYNFNPARIFMGDCGSMFLGFVLGSCGVIIASRTHSAAAVCGFLLAVGIPLLDLALTMLRRRVLQRRSIFAAERGHIHHQLLDRGWSHRGVVLLLYGVTGVVAALGLLATLQREAFLVTVVSAGVLVLAVLFYRAGSLQPRILLQAYRRNLCMARDNSNHRRGFDQMQLRFRQVRTFEAWWDELCRAAGMLQFISICLPLRNRDGTVHELKWHRDERGQRPGSSKVAPVSAVIPIKHRRIGEVLEARVQLAVSESLEDAGRRMMLFSRLTEEHSLASLPQDPMTVRHGWTATDGSLRGANPVCSTQHVSAASSVASKEASGSDKSVISVTSDPLSTAGRIDRSETEFPMITSNTRIAVVHDFLYTYAGAERVLEQILRLYPQADLFSLFDFLPASERGFIGNRTVKSSFIQRLPMARTKHRTYLPLMPLAIEQLDVSNYDLVISSSYVAAKGVITRPDQLHICYCHSPVRFAWDLQQQYLQQSQMTTGLKSVLARAILHYIRNWDTRSANGVDSYVTNSDFVSRRIQKVYRRSSTTIYPPVDTESYSLHPEKDDFYLTVSRMVPYKKIDLIVESFGRMPNRRLIVIGDGPEADKIKARASSNVRFMGYQPFEILRHYMQRARAFVFAAEEDFGIVPTEAQACGTPVIAFGRGGVTESVIPGVTGLFFDEQTVDSLVDAVTRFEASPEWSPHTIRRNAERFSTARFCNEFSKFVDEKMQDFRERCAVSSHEDFMKPYAMDIEPRMPLHAENTLANGSANGNGHGHAKHSVRI
ncbi:MAG: glycosyltransferase [Burkholderiales bacterium]|nr:glycosyltransferase [Phycisphaerae bacterium]